MIWLICDWYIFQDELEKELEELEQEELDKELLGTGPTADQLPSVPTADLPVPAARAKPCEFNTRAL